MLSCTTNCQAPIGKSIKRITGERGRSDDYCSRSTGYSEKLIDGPSAEGGLKMAVEVQLRISIPFSSLAAAKGCWEGFIQN